MVGGILYNSLILNCSAHLYLVFSMYVFPQNLATPQNHTTLKISPHIGVNSHNTYTVVLENFGIKVFLDALWCPKIKQLKINMFYSEIFMVRKNHANACPKAATDNKSKKRVPYILLLSVLPDNEYSSISSMMMSSFMFSRCLQCSHRHTILIACQF